ncbi:hypothetical protein J2W46_005847 [Paraburkholderia strydomiana]|nr:hypothetical protein [Paraburkholderia strydomiana]
MDERKRDSMIAYLRHRIDDFGLNPGASLPFWRQTCGIEYRSLP